MTNNFDSIEDELKFIFETRKTSYPNNPKEFLKRLGQIYLLGTISEEAFNIAKDIYNGTGSAKKSSSSRASTHDPYESGGRVTNSRC
jgi:hypothetical protein